MLRWKSYSRVLLVTLAAAAAAPAWAASGLSIIGGGRTAAFTPIAADPAAPDAPAGGSAYDESGAWDTAGTVSAADDRPAVRTAAFPSHARSPYGPAAADRPLIAAHRGASKYAPENTMAAFRLAETMGADFIELDVRASRDGRLIVLHDGTVDRTTDGAGRADELTFREIRRLDAGGWFSPAFSGERIPSLEEVLDRFGGGIGLILELKQPSDYPGIERALARLLTERGLDRPERGRVVIQSFDTDSLRRVRELLPDVPIAVLARPRRRVTSRDLAEYRRFADAVHLPRSSARTPVIRRIRSCGLSVMVWNVRGKRQLRQALDYGVNGILTDDPLLLDR